MSQRRENSASTQKRLMTTWGAEMKKRGFCCGRAQETRMRVGYTWKGVGKRRKTWDSGRRKGKKEKKSRATRRYGQGTKETTTLAINFKSEG